MHLAQPAWLLLLVLLPILGAGAVLVARLRRKQWHAFVAERLRPVLLRTSSPLARWFSLIFLLAATAALIIAMSRPQGNAGTRAEKTTGRNILIALDLSRSMRVTDVKPDRLAQAKVVIYELLEALPNERVGLIGFAGTAHLLAPLTIDHGAVRETVEQADENWVAMGGSDFTAALRLAISTLKETGQKNNALIILSDGEKHDESLVSIIDEAKRAGVYIFAVGVGTDDGGFVPSEDFPNGRMIGPDGKPVLSRLQPATLRRLATDTLGRFATASGSTDIPTMVKLAAKDLDAFEMKGRERHFTIEFYQWLVLPAIVFLMVSIVAATRWRPTAGNTAGTAATIACGILLTHQPARAGEAADAKSQLEQGHLDQARTAFGTLATETRFPERSARYSLGEATAAYRAKDYSAARAAFSRALLSADPEVAGNAHFGLANSLFQIGWKTLAKSPYPTDPKAVPDLAGFDTIVKDRLAAILKTETEPDQSTPGIAELENLAVNWADAVEHYDSALLADPANPDLQHNRETTMTFIKRLLQLLEQERQQTEESIPEPQPSPAPGNPGEEPSKGPGQQPDDQKNPENQGDPKNNPGDQGDPDGNNPGDQGKQPDDPKPDPNDQPGDKPPDPPKDPSGQQPGETPEETARRILGENADLQKGPPRAGRHLQRVPKKDW